MDQGIFYGIGEENDALPSVPLVTTFSDKEENILLAWWLPWNMQKYLPKLAKVTISLKGIDFDDPVMLDPLTSDVYEIEITNTDTGCVLKEVVLADYPFIIVERKTIKIS